MGSIKCYIVYELMNSTSLTTPLWWEYRVFLAVGYLSVHFLMKTRRQRFYSRSRAVDLMVEREILTIYIKIFSNIACLDRIGSLCGI
jgi:hypothetical protein